MQPSSRVRLAAFLFLSLLPMAGSAAEADLPYQVSYHARFLPEDGLVEAAITVDQPRQRLVLLDFRAPEERFRDFAADGDIRREGPRLLWQVPAGGGRLSYRVTVDHRRDGGYDARLTDTWAIVRLGDLFPAARVRSRRGAYSDATLSLAGPEDWSFETRYGPVRDEPVAVDTAGRRFDRPIGWLAAGEVGIRRTRVADRRIAIAGPKDEGFRRMDLLTFLRWTLPELVRVAPSLPERILIVGGAAEMWRGGLSGPGSLYVHPDRPLVSGNATSTFLHELMHVATEEPPAAGDDWIVEGLAEYYSLVVLLRSDGISGARFERALETLGAWVAEKQGRLADPSTGADTARAALLFRDLHLELAAEGGSLDDVVAELLGGGRVNRQRLRTLVEDELGRASRVLESALRGAPET